MNSKIPKASDYSNFSSASEIERMIKSNMLDVTRPKATDFLHESMIEKSIREMQKITGMPKDDYGLSALAKTSAIDPMQKILASQNLTGISKQMESELSRMNSMQKMLEPIGMRDLLKNSVMSPDFSRVNEIQKLVESIKFDAVTRMEKISGISVSSLSGFNKFQEMLESKNVAYSEKIEKMFGVSSMKSMWETALEASKLNHFDDVRRIENDLFNSSVMRTMREISELTSFKALNSLSNLPFENLAKNFVFDERLFNAFDAGHLGTDLFEMDAEIAEEIETATDFNLLSDSAKQKLLSIYHTYLLPILISYVVAVCTGSNPDIEENLLKLLDTHEQVELIDKPSENNSPDNKRNESETISTTEIAELSENSRADKLAQLRASQHDPLFIADLQGINDEFAHIDNEGW
jgi:hypothetical protein